MKIDATITLPKMHRDMTRVNRIEATNPHYRLIMVDGTIIEADLPHNTRIDRDNMMALVTAVKRAARAR